MRIAIAVDNDKKTIIKKTGQAVYFAIYEDENPVEYIKNNHEEGNHGKGDPEGGAHHHHEHLHNEKYTSSHKKDIMGIKDCDIILVQAVGEHMKEVLVSLGITVKKIRKKDGITADEAVKNFLNNNI